MIRIADLKLPLGREESLLKKRAAKQLHIPVEQITSWRISKITGCPEKRPYPLCLRGGCGCG